MSEDEMLRDEPSEGGTPKDALREDIIRLVKIICYERMMKAYGLYIVFPGINLELYNNSFKILITTCSQERIEIFYKSKKPKIRMITVQMPGEHQRVVWHPERSFSVKIADLQWVRDTLEQIIQQADIMVR